jgi:hypothetical protein
MLSGHDMARFRVTYTFSFSVGGRHLFVLVGDVVEGMIRVGMSLRHPDSAWDTEFLITGVATGRPINLCPERPGGQQRQANGSGA